MLVERPLDGTPQPGPSDANDHLFPNSVDPDAGDAKRFMVRHPSAKVVFIVNTHCLPSGFFIWKGDGPESYEGCSLLEVGLPMLTDHESPVDLT